MSERGDHILWNKTEIHRLKAKGDHTSEHLQWLLHRQTYRNVHTSGLHNSSERMISSLNILPAWGDIQNI